MDYCGVCRTSYFKVKDVEAFKTWCEKYDLDVIDDKDTRFGDVYGFASEGSGFPMIRYNEEIDDYESVDFFRELSAHLVEGWVAVCQEIGREGMRYFVGVSVAVYWDGRKKLRSIEDIGVDIQAEDGHILYTECQY